MPRVRNFIKSFPTDDRPTIELLLSSIQVVSLSQLQDDLMAALSEHIDKTNIPSKGFIVDPVIGTDDLQKWHKINLSKFKSGTLSKKVQDIRYYLHAEPSEIFHDGSGSEHFSAVVRRDIRSKVHLKMKQRLLSNPMEKHSFDELNFIFIVDNSATGTQIIRFIDQVIQSLDVIIPCPRLKEVKVLITVIAWGATRKAIEVVTDKYKSLPEGVEFELKYLNYIQTCKDFSDEEVLDSVSKSIDKYKIKGKYSHFSDVASLTVFEGHSCPNNLPNFLFRNRSKTKHSLFENRFVTSMVAGELRERYSTIAKPEFKDIHGARFRAKGLYRIWCLTNLKDDNFYKYLCYVAVRDSIEVATALLACPYAEKLEIIEEAFRLAYVDTDFNLTKRGLEALRGFERSNRYLLRDVSWRKRTSHIDSAKALYYPTSVGGVAIRPGIA